MPHSGEKCLRNSFRDAGCVARDAGNTKTFQLSFLFSPLAPRPSPLAPRPAPRIPHPELFFQSRAEPGPRVLPVPVGYRARKPQRCARLLDGESTEKVKFRDLRRFCVFFFETGE